MDKEKMEKFIVRRMSYLPIEFNVLIKSFVAWCGTCCKPFYPEHLEEHGVKRVRIEEIFEDLSEIVEGLKQKYPNGRVKRGEVMEKTSSHMRMLLADVNKVLMIYSYSFRS